MLHPAVTLDHPPNQAQGCKSMKAWMLRNQAARKSLCASSSDAFRDHQAGNRHLGEVEPQQPAAVCAA